MLGMLITTTMAGPWCAVSRRLPRWLVPLALLGSAAAAQAAVNAPALKWAYGGCTGSASQRACERGWYASPAVADIDGDGQAEVLWGGYNLSVVAGADGVLRGQATNGNRIWPGIVVADLTGDGTLEVVVGRNGDSLSVYRPIAVAPGGGVNLQVLWTRSPFGGGEIRTLAVDDLESDGSLEIVVGRGSSGATRQLSVYDAAGNVRPGWPARRNGEPGYGAGLYNENVAVADFDGDGLKELIVPTDTHYITALDRNGNQLGTSTLYNSFNPQGPKLWSQVGVHLLHAIDLQGFADCGHVPPAPLARRLRPNFANSAPSIADLDGDGSLELVVPGDVYDCDLGDPAGDLYHLPFVLKRDRTRFVGSGSGSGFDWTGLPAPVAGSAPRSQDYNVIENSVQNAVLADLDGDGRQEILYASYDGRLHAWWLDKSEHGAWPITAPFGAGESFRFASEPVVVDLDNDGLAEVLFTTWPRKTAGLLGRLHIANHLGQILHSIDLPVPATFASTWNGALGAPTLANLDGDADLEVVVGTVASGLVAYDLPGSAQARVLWGTGRGSLRRTGFIPTGALSIGDQTLAEGQAGSNTLLVTVTLAAPRPASTRVHFATADGSAQAGSDYTAVSGVLDFPPYVVSRTIAVPILGDTRDEPDESFAIELSAPSGATLVDPQAVVTIQDDDPMPGLSVADLVLAEGQTGASAAMLTVALTAPSGRDISVNYTTANGSASAGSDYGAVAGALGFPAGTTNRSVFVSVFGDRLFEADETFTLALAAPVNASLLDGQASVILTNDDVAGLTVSDARVAEPRSGTATLTFVVTVTPAPAGAVSVDYATVPGSAAADDDYVPASGALAFDGSTPSRTLAVTVKADGVVETIETLGLHLSNASGAPLAVADGTGRIVEAVRGGDFNADGHPDLFWRHRQTGALNVWLMDGSVRSSEVVPTPGSLAASWRVAGTADFDGDGQSDILWHDATTGALRVWRMSGVTRLSELVPTPAGVPDLNWRSVGTGDFDADGKPDILWRHAVSGRNVVWLMDGIVRTTGVFTTPDTLADLNWQMVGVADFSDDGQPDILWRHALSGKTVVWLMNGTVRTSGQFTSPDALSDANWRAVGLGDLSRDGRPDLIWRHAVSGTNVVWFMDGSVRVAGSATTPASLADTEWELVGPR